MHTVRAVQEAVDDLGVFIRSYTKHHNVNSGPHRRLATKEFNRARKLLNDIAFHRGEPVAVLVTTGEESLHGHALSDAGKVLASRTVARPDTTLTIKDLIPVPPSHMIALESEDGTRMAVPTEELLSTVSNGGRLLLQERLSSPER